MTRVRLPGVRDAARIERSWQAAAEEVGGRYGLTYHFRPYIRLATPNHQVVIQLWYTGTGFRTALRAPFHDPGETSLAVGDEDGFDSLLKSLGFIQDIKIGDEAFDERFVVRGRPRARVLELLAPPVPELMMAQRVLDLRITGTLFGERYPRGITELVVQNGRIVRTTAEIVGLLRIASTLVTRLDPLGGVERSDFDELLERLARPRGRVTDMQSGVVLWEGDPPRRDSIRRLMELGDLRAVPVLLDVLDDPEPEVVADAIGALASLADPVATPRLVALLGRTRDAAHGETLAHHAGEALRAFGEDAVVDAVARALAGDRDGFLDAIGRYREPVAVALMDVLDSFDLEARVEAAVALGELGAREALPLLREKRRAMGLKTKLTEAAREAIEAIEAQASLPKPAAPLPDDSRSTLPRPATPRRSASGETLPRPIDD